MCTTAHHILGGIMPILLKNGCLVTLRYCELSVTEFVFVCLFLYFAQLFALFLAYAHALKSSVLHLVFFYYFIHCFYFLLLVGFTHATRPFNSFMWDLCSELGCHTYRRRTYSWYICVRAWYVLFMSQILLIICFFLLCVYCDFTQRPHC